MPTFAVIWESDPNGISEQYFSENATEVFEKVLLTHLQCVSKSFCFSLGKSSNSGWSILVIQDKLTSASWRDRGHSEKRKVFSSKAIGHQYECLWNSQGKWVSSNGTENRKTRTRPALLGCCQEAACPFGQSWATPTS